MSNPHRHIQLANTCSMLVCRFLLKRLDLYAIHPSSVSVESLCQGGHMSDEVDKEELERAWRVCYEKQGEDGLARQSPVWIRDVSGAYRKMAFGNARIDP